MEKIKYYDGSVWKTVQADISQGVEIDNISAELEWDLTTKDDSPETYVAPHVGGRPNDR